MSLRLVFAGTPPFAAAALQALATAGHTVQAVLTQPDRPAGRGLKLQPSAVKQLALAAGWPVLQPRSLRLDGRWPEEAHAAREALRALQPEVMVVAAYGLILPAWALALPREGCLNIHGSLLPRWRGAAPIQRAIEAGDRVTGITIMQMDEGLDTGDERRSAPMPIAADATAATLTDGLAVLGAAEIVAALAELESGRLPRHRQPAEGVCYAHKIDKREAAIDWQRPAAEIERRIRAFDPFPGASTALGDDTLKVWRAQVLPGAAPPDAPPGTVLAADPAGLPVACGDGVLALTTLQLPGGRRLPAAEVLQTPFGRRLQPGVRLAGVPMSQA